MTSTNESARYKGAPSLDYPWNQEYFPMQSATTIQGTLNSEDVSENIGYTAEVFFPWSIFGLDAKPEKMLIYPALYHIESETETSKTGTSYKFLNVKNLTLNKPEVNLTDNFIVMEEKGLSSSNSSFEPQDIYFSNEDLNGDYYEKTLSFAFKIKNVKDGFVCKENLITPTFELPSIVEYVVNEDETITFRVKKDKIDELELSKYKMIVDGEEHEAEIAYLPVSIDGELDELYTMKHSSMNDKNSVSVDTNVYLNKDGIFMLINVLDSNIKDSSRIETFLYIDELGFDTAWHFRFYPNSASYKYRIYEYTTPDSLNWAWVELTGNSKPSMSYISKVTSDGYVIEAFISFAELGIEGDVTEINMITVCGLYDVNSGSVVVYDGNTKATNAYYLNKYNYINYDKDDAFLE